MDFRVSMANEIAPEGEWGTLMREASRDESIPSKEQVAALHAQIQAFKFIEQGVPIPEHIQHAMLPCNNAIANLEKSLHNSASAEEPESKEKSAERLTHMTWAGLLPAIEHQMSAPIPEHIDREILPHDNAIANLKKPLQCSVCARADNNAMMVFDVPGGQNLCAPIPEHIHHEIPLCNNAIANLKKSLHSPMSVRANNSNVLVSDIPDEQSSCAPILEHICYETLPHNNAIANLEKSLQRSMCACADNNAVMVFDIPGG
ncbi:SNF21_2 [Sanghuangporus sanghuang]